MEKSIQLWQMSFYTMKHPLQNGQALYLLRKIVSESGFYVLISIFGIKGQCGTQKGIVYRPF